MPRKITHTIYIEASPSEVFNSLISPGSIKKWWFANCAIVLPQKGGCYDVLWGEEDDPDYITSSTIIDIQTPNFLHLMYGKYYSKSGEMPFEAKFEVLFEISENKDGTDLKVTQKGFPDDAIADPYLQGCIKGWNDTCASLKSVIEH
jgi:uncharacterized protein YndB with AHSA1/START domain